MTKNIFKFTGNPFVDNGVALITVWAGKKKPEDVDDSDLLEITNQISTLYFEVKWKNRIQFIFPNSKITNPSPYLNPENKKKEYTNLLLSFIKAIVPFSKSGDCISCGSRDGIFYLTKDKVPLSGSGEYLNFFASFERGERYCGACTLSIQLCVPMVMDCNKFLLIHSNNYNVLLYMADFILNKVTSQLASGSFEGMYKNDFYNEKNALFHIINKIIIPQFDDEIWNKEDTLVSCYFFSNANQKGQLYNIYQVPSEVFDFLCCIKTLDKKYKEKNILKDWDNIIYNAYLKVKIKKNESPDIKIKNSYNQVYESLLNGSPIIRYFYNSSEKKALCPWELTELYLSKVRKMEKERIDVIKKLADNIVEIMKSKENTKRLFGLENARYYSGLRATLILCARDWQNMNKNQPLIRLDDAIELLFPETSEGWKNWKETRDLLLFRIYETSHDWIVKNRSEEEKKEEILIVEQDGGNKDE
ncbi:type I-B CRISPR-associated protein Cas8b1/Cst1 [Candidatus Woesearchaeota archaeon]|nr:type I-B CRISPR-associated protein Cas8b1/Cst1 [Candidatus Woesearchaeota archaeon]